MRTFTLILLLSTFASVLPAANTMEVYAIDAEGGHALLTISSSEKNPPPDFIANVSGPTA